MRFLENQTHATIEKLSRIDARDYPILAIRETLLNLLIHRDYSLSASSLISIYDNKIEFMSVGGLAKGIELEDVMAGLSICRNQNLVNIFYRLHLIEAYGTGLRKIMDAYKTSLEKPVISVTKNSFKIILPNINAKHISEGSTQEYDENEQKVLNYVKENGKITRPEAENLLKTSASTASRLLKEMINNNLLKTKGKARNIQYICQ